MLFTRLYTNSTSQSRHHFIRRTGPTLGEAKRLHITISHCELQTQLRLGSPQVRQKYPASRDKGCSKKLSSVRNCFSFYKKSDYSFKSCFALKILDIGYTALQFNIAILSPLWWSLYHRCLRKSIEKKIAFSAKATRADIVAAKPFGINMRYDGVLVSRQTS